MKDFADLNNSVGAFPVVTAQDCSGPGETDGTEIIAETITDNFGWIQALLTEVGATPSGVAESTTVSQILEALRLLPAQHLINLNYAYMYTGGVDWSYLNDYWESLVNTGLLYCPLYLPPIEMDLTVKLRVTPGAARAGGNRMRGRLSYRTSDSPNYLTLAVDAYDDGTTNIQDITLTKSFTPSADRLYRIQLDAGNTGAASPDELNFIEVIKSK